jgi:uncharacterized RDD family membrane protein YckC
MQFIVVDHEGNRSAPLSRKEVEQWIVEGRLDATSDIRNAMIDKWNKLGNLKQFEDALAQAEEVSGEQENSGKKSASPAKEKIKRHTASAADVSETTFRNKVEAVPGGLVLRLLAGLLDWLLMALVAVLLLGGVALAVYFKGITTDTVKAEPVEQEQTETVAETEVDVPAELVDMLSGTAPPTDQDNFKRGYRFGSLWVDVSSDVKYSCIRATNETAVWVRVDFVKMLLAVAWTIFSLVAILYFAIGYGVFAQTFGMWYWGVFIAKKDGGEALPFRCFVYTMLMFCLGWSIIVLALFTHGRGFHDLFAGVSIYKISGQRA